MTVVCWDVMSYSLADWYHTLEKLAALTSLKIQAAGYSKMLVPIYQNMGNHIHKHHDLNTHCHETPQMAGHS